MEIDPNAKRRIEDYIRTSLKGSVDAGASETEMELRSHLYEAAQRHAEAAASLRIEVSHVETALREMGAPAQVAKDLGPAPSRWRTRVPLTRRGFAAIGLAFSAAFVGLAYIVVGGLCRFSRPGSVESFETCTPGVSAWGGFFVAAVLAGVVGVWLAVRWIPLVASAFLLALPFLSIGGDWFFGPLCAALFIAAAGLLPTQSRPMKRANGPAWHYLVFVPVGLIAALFVHGVLRRWFGMQLEGLPTFLTALFLSVVAIWGLLLLLLRRRDARFAAGTMAIVVLTTFVGFMVVFAASFAGSGCFPRGPASATWNDDALFERMPRPDRYGNFTVTRDAPSVGLPFDNATLDERYGRDNYSLASVSWAADMGDHWGETPMTLEPGPRLSFMWGGDTSDVQVQAAAMRFLANVTSASAERVKAIAEDLVAARMPRGQVYTADPAQGAAPIQVYWSSVALDAPLRLQDLWHSHGGQATPSVSDSRLDAEWTYSFSYATFYARGTMDKRPVEFTVNAEGVASISIAGVGIAGPEEGRRVVEALYRDLALGSAPAVQPASTQSICID